MHDNQTTMPLVSVIIPTFNRAHMLGDAIDSVLQQTYQNFELLVVDDGSTDNTKEFIETYNDPRIKYFQIKNGGVSAARNVGIKNSKGSYISFLDSDDKYNPDCLKNKMNVALINTNCVVVGGGCSYFSDSGSCSLPTTPARTITSYEDLCIFTAFPGATGNIFVSRTALLKAGVFSESLSVSEDRDLLRRLSLIGEIKFCEDVTISMRIHPEFRPNRDHHKKYNDREWVSNQIPDSNLRKRSRAWNAMLIGYDYWDAGEKLQAIRWWLRSFLIYPRQIHPELNRIKPIFRDYLLKH